jgi:cytochrome c-type biogenesis protein CcmH/NrfG
MRCCCCCCCLSAADTLFGADLTIMEEGTELLHRLQVSSGPVSGFVLLFALLTGSVLLLGRYHRLLAAPQSFERLLALLSLQLM